MRPCAIHRALLTAAFFQRRAVRFIASFEPPTRGMTHWPPSFEFNTDISHSHLPHAGLDATRASTGVVWCTERAAEYGFLEEPDKWANLGRKHTISRLNT